jgi:hypothetical protein
MKQQSPPLLIAENLELPSRLEEIDHRRSLANHSCISTNPEDWRGGMVRNA